MEKLKEEEELNENKYILDLHDILKDRCHSI